MSDFLPIAVPVFSVTAVAIWCAVANCIRAHYQACATHQLAERIQLLESKIQVVIEPQQPRAVVVPVPVQPASLDPGSHNYQPPSYQTANYRPTSYYPPYSSAYQGQSLPVTR